MSPFTLPLIFIAVVNSLVTARVSVRNQRDEEVLVFTPVRLIRGADYSEVQH